MSDDGTTVANPYKGLESYETRDRYRFFGRDDEARRLCDLVIANPVSLLHAASGAGKTSLINARLIPDLEERGFSAVRARPESSPQSEIREETLCRLFPDPAHEVGAIDRLLKNIADLLPEIGLDTDLRTLKHRFSELRQADRELKAALKVAAALDAVLAPIARGKAEQPYHTTRRMIPFVVRFLEFDGGERFLANHIFAVDAWARNELKDLSGFRLDTGRLAEPLQQGDVAAVSDALAGITLRELRAIFAAPALAEAYAVFRTLYGQAEQRLAPFFDLVARQWGRRRAFFGIVLILDQFEEVFTRFRGAPANPKAPSLAKRESYLSELLELFRWCAGEAYEPSDDRSSRYAPLRILLSMRDEHIAQLDPLERAFASLPKHHLTFVPPEEAVRLVQEPARKFGVDFETAACQSIVDDLKTDDGLIEPPHVQIVCPYIWKSALSSWELEPAASKHITLDDIQVQRFGDPRVILDTHLDNVLKRYEGGKIDDEIRRFEALTLLDPLVTAGRRRTIVDEDTLIEVPGHNDKLRREVLEHLVQRNIVRLEWRGRERGRMAEVTHEFLINPILSAIDRELRGEPIFRDLAAGLAKLGQADLLRRVRHKEVSPFTQPEFDALHRFRDYLALGSDELRSDRAEAQDGRAEAQREHFSRLAMEKAANELMYRSAVLLQPAGARSPTPALVHWSRKLGSAPIVIDQAEVLEDLPKRARDRRLLDRIELELVRMASGAAADRWKRDRATCAFLLKSAIECGLAAQRDTVEFFARAAAECP